ncbi:SIMPL domain-containing protein [Altererythrobacter sp. RZ02]|uniref:SIMPL domain-containing protein n=1 Tax=Pontixanthobacter rizhaonensis TaxID=2730337 RepID=A0A848QJ60_9SPHN|nr:SIMPL domain-containing protein [Pontixanthobacter rizhaonensis]NMW30703.1 SIMPL domain-containing protein [Pontixanthobacter rizhaonensis]
MTDTTSETPPTATPFWQQQTTRLWLSASTIIAIGLIAGGFLLGDGLVRAKEADRSVTVRGLAEREVTADLATWTVAYSASAPDLQSAQAAVDQDTKSIEEFFKKIGFPEEALQPTGVNVSFYSDRGVPRYTVRQRLTLRTTDIERAENAVKRQVELVRRGVVLEDGSGMAYTFTKLDEIKPDMVAAATKDARAAAEQFASDSGTGVGKIRKATQGYFSIDARDGEAGGWGVSDTPYKKVRVVTTVDFSLD